MKLYEHWLPLRNEDAQTALVFGALRHLRPELALRPWLSSVLGRPVQAAPLAPDHFWPRFPSIVEGSTATEPELLFEADDGRPLLIVIENKPSYGGHTLEQVSREAVDAAMGSRAERLALIMVGADIGPPMDRAGWEGQVANVLKQHWLDEVDVELAYSSWAALGRGLEIVAQAESDWARYVDDVLSQLRFIALLGYDEAPMFDDLDGLTVPNAVEAYNRAVKAIRQFFLSLHGQPRSSWSSSKSSRRSCHCARSHE